MKTLEGKNVMIKFQLTQEEVNTLVDTMSNFNWRIDQSLKSNEYPGKDVIDIVKNDLAKRRGIVAYLKSEVVKQLIK